MFFRVAMILFCFAWYGFANDAQYSRRGGLRDVVKENTNTTKPSVDSSKQRAESKNASESSEYWSEEELELINISKKQNKKIKEKNNEELLKLLNRTHQFYFSTGYGLSFNSIGVGYNLASISLGYMWLLKDTITIRPYVNAGISMIPYTYQSNDYYFSYTYSTFYAEADASLNFDVMGNFYTSPDKIFSVGGLVGLGYGASAGSGHDWADSSTNIRLNLGLKMVWIKRHGIEVIARIPIASLSSTTSIENNSNITTSSRSGYRTTTISLSYSRTF